MNDPCDLSVFLAPSLSDLFLSRVHLYLQAYHSTGTSAGDREQARDLVAMQEETSGSPSFPRLSLL